MGLITNVTREDGRRLAYAYNGLDRLISEKELAGGAVIRQAAFSYDAAGNRLGKTGPTASVSYSYPYGNSGNRLSSWTAAVSNQLADVVWTRVTGGSSETIGTSSVLGALWVSNRVAQAPQVSGTNFWVAVCPLTEGTQTIVAAVGDLAGNVGLGAVTAVVHVAHGGAYQYNAAGCVTNITYTSGLQALRYGLAWDGEYRLKAVSTNGALAEAYGYDGLGRRVFIEGAGARTWLVYDGIHVIAETTASGALARSYSYGAGIDNALSMTVYGATTNTYYYLTDHLGTVHALADAAGTIVESYEYDAWGRVLGVYDAAGAPLAESVVGNRILWQGREYSWKSGLYYFRARWYDPVTGRWLSNDPIGISGGLNQYVFCANNPVNFRDPNGEFLQGLLLLEFIGAYTVNAPIPGGGRVLALTLPGTTITIVGWNYFRLDPIAQQIVSAHEAVHSRTPFWWGITHHTLAEIDAYREQYCKAKDLMAHWRERTGLPMGGKAWDDVNMLGANAAVFLEEHGVPVSP